MVDGFFDLPDAVRADARLVVSELVTNACLHGAPPITVQLRETDGMLRVEVSDVGRAMPVRPQTNPEAMTGRGFALVGAIARQWGVDPLPQGGKTVWAELTESTGSEEQPDAVDADQLLAMWDDQDDDLPDAEERYPVHLGVVPTELLLEAKSHIDDVIRELKLMSADDGGESLPVPVQRLFTSVTEDFAEARASIKRQALQAAGRGDVVTELRLHLPLSAADAGERYLAALDEIDKHSRAAQLLTLVPRASHRAFRRWYLRALIDQLRARGRGETPQPTPPFSQVLATAIDDLSNLVELQSRLELLQDVTARLVEADTVEQMAEIVADRAAAYEGVESVRVYTVTDHGTARSVAWHGQVSGVADTHAEFALDAELPGADVIRTGEPLHIRTVAQLYARYPQLSRIYPEDWSLHQVPLSVAGHVIGLLSLTFRAGEVADDDELSFVRSIADALAQAIERGLTGQRAEAERKRELALLKPSTRPWRR